jgi:hypothetical protein
MRRFGPQKVPIECLQGRLFYSFGGYFLVADKIRLYNKFETE